MEEGFSWLPELKQALVNMSRVEIFAVITGLIYVILAVKEIIWCWIFGIISSLLSIYLFYTDQLFAESILYFYYVLAGVYGWWAWSKKKGQENNSDKEITIHTWSILNHTYAIIGGSILAMMLAYLLKTFTSAQIPVLDSFTTIFSFIATYMVTRKVLENWIYWIIIDVVTAGMYFYRDFYLYSLLMIVYTIIAVIGYVNWLKLKNDKKWYSA